MSGTMKWYLLAQLSFWLQQIIVVNIEEKRKDHYQMFTHHIITSTLLGSAYIYGFYNVSNVVLCLMDVADFLLPVCLALIAHHLFPPAPLTDYLSSAGQNLEILEARSTLHCHLRCNVSYLAGLPPCSLFIVMLVHLQERPCPNGVRMLFRDHGGDAHH